MAKALRRVPLASKGISVMLPRAAGYWQKPDTDWRSLVETTDSSAAYEEGDDDGDDDDAADDDGGDDDDADDADAADYDCDDYVDDEDDNKEEQEEEGKDGACA